VAGGRSLYGALNLSTESRTRTSHLFKKDFVIFLVVIAGILRQAFAVPSAYSYRR